MQMFWRMEAVSAANLAGLRTRLRPAWLVLGVAIGALVWWSVAAGHAGAQEMPVPATMGITTVGDGVATATPDTTTINLGVQVNGATPSEALSQTRQVTERVLQRLRAMGIPETDLQTSGFNVYPIEGRPPDGSSDPLRVSGYRGNASLTAKVADVNRAGAVLDAGIQAGATSVGGLSFGIADESQLRARALVAAIGDATKKAEAAAGAAGMKITGIRAIVELTQGLPFRGTGLGGGGGEGIAPGQLTINSRVQVTFDVSR
jgi:uncharacterized protein YggE